MGKIVNWLNRHLEESLMILLLSAMVLLMSMQIFMRYVMTASLTWPEELIRYMFIWFVFLGISYGIREGIHLRVDLVEIAIPRLRPWLTVIQNAIFLVFLIYMFKPGWSALRSLLRSGQTSAAMDLPMVYVYASLWFGFILGLLRMLQKLVMSIVRIARPTAEEGQK